MPAPSLYLRLCLWFLGITALYLPLAMHFGYWTHSSDRHDIGDGNPLVLFLGLFAPVGPSNWVLYLVPPFGWVLAIGVLASIFVLDKMTQTVSLSPLQRIALNLSILFAISMIVDLTMFGEPLGFTLFFQSLF